MSTAEKVFHGGTLLLGGMQPKEQGRTEAHRVGMTTCSDHRRGAVNSIAQSAGTPPMYSRWPAHGYARLGHMKPMNPAAPVTRTFRAEAE
jgi:hypothetical protein